MNKYGGVNDLKACDKRVYSLWYQMLRRCYDEEQQKRNRGKSYADCDVSERWLYLSRFAEDIKTLEGYKDWKNNKGFCLDKDIRIKGNKCYDVTTCCFVPISKNIRESNQRNKNILKNANEARKTNYILEKEGEIISFSTEKEACDFLKVRQSSVCSCFRKGYKCKGYTIKRNKKAKMDLED